MTELRGPLFVLALALTARVARADEAPTEEPAAASEASPSEASTSPSEASTSPSEASASPSEASTSPSEASTSLSEASPALRRDVRLGAPDDALGVPFASWVELGVFAASPRNDTLALGSLDLGLSLAIGGDARATLDWGLAFGATRVVGSYAGSTMVEPYDRRFDRVEARNAQLGLAWSPRIASDVRFGVGLAVVIPIAATTVLPSSADTQAVRDASLLVHEGYLASQGGVRAWRYRPERFGVVVPLSLTFALGERGALRIEVEGALESKVIGGVAAEPSFLGDVDSVVDLGGEVAAGLSLGVRGSVALVALGYTNDVQPALEPWARVDVGPVSLFGRALVGLGGPYGLGSSFPGWGAHLGVSVDVR